MSVYRPEERRLVLRLMAYWDDLRGDRAYPAVGDLDPGTIGDDWDACFVMALKDPVDASVFRHVGASLTSRPVPGDGSATLRGCPEATLLHHAVRNVPRMLEKGVPVSVGGEAAVDGAAVLYRSILLPLSDDGERIDHILGAANSRRVTTGDG